MFGKKRKAPGPEISFDRESQRAVLKCSICTGEQVAGFKDKKTGQFTEVMLIKNQDDLKWFQEHYGVEHVTKEY